VGRVLSAPYATTAEFVEWPTFLDLLNLRSGDPQLAHQTAVLNKILLTASGWCDNYVNLGDTGTLAAHTRTERKRMRPDRNGRLLWHPDHAPFISLEALSYGSYIGQQTTYLAPPVFPEDNRNIVVDLQAGTSAWAGSLQFGVPRSSRELYTTWQYTAGYPNALLTAPVAAGVASLPLSDVTGIQAGLSMRIYDPGLDENVTVASSWVQSVGPGTVPLTTGVINTHTGPTRASTMTSDVFEATLLYTVALLMRPDTKAEDAFPNMHGGVSTRLGDSRQDGAGLVCEAKRLLDSYRRTI
jgi:hypothetical protein